MGMDNAEAIKRIKDHIRVHHIGEYPHIKIAEALNMAISALANDNNVGHKVEIPCKIGDEVWAIRNYNGVKHPQKGFVSDMLFTRDMKLHIVVKHIARGEWGKDVFATYEEAAEAIGERKTNAN